MSDENGKPHWWEPDPEHERKQKRLQFVFGIVVVIFFLLWLFHQ